MACAFLCRTGAYLDQELAAAERAAYEAHLSACGECARELERLARLSRFLSAAGRNAGDTIPIQGAELPEFRFLWKPLAYRQKLVRFAELLMAAAALVMAVCGLWLLRSGSRSDSAAMAGWEQMALERVQPAELASESEGDEALVQAILRGQP